MKFKLIRALFVEIVFILFFFKKKNRVINVYFKYIVDIQYIYKHYFKVNRVLNLFINFDNKKTDD